MQPSNKIIGIVLAGGQSSRMGQDKALLKHSNGQTWLAHTKELLDKICDEVWVSGRNGEFCIADHELFAGPAAAIVQCVLQLPTCSLLFVPVDLPFLAPETLQKLLNHHAEAVHYEHHPLPLLIRSSPNVKRCLQNLQTPSHLSVYQLLTELKTEAIPVDHVINISLTNANRPEDLSLSNNHQSGA